MQLEKGGSCHFPHPQTDKKGVLSMSDHTQRKYLYQHTSQETAYVVDDYPWGFRLRTKIRYWIETKKSHGQRFCSQTINPKTGKWCAPKYSTYSEVEVLFLDEKNHVCSTGLSLYSDEDRLKAFKEIHWENLDDFQKDKLRLLAARDEVMKHVTFEIVPCSIGPVSLLSNDPLEVEKRKQIMERQEAHKKEQDLIKRKINAAIGNRYKKNQMEMV